jgi:hypothetical protein
VLNNRGMESVVNICHAMPEDVPETDQNRQIDTAQRQVIRKFLKIDCS